MGGHWKKVKIKTKWAEPFIILVGEYPGPTGDGDENLCRVPHVGLYYGIAKKDHACAKPLVRVSYWMNMNGPRLSTSMAFLAIP
jgi:hypothetical protein